MFPAYPTPPSPYQNLYHPTVEGYLGFLRQIVGIPVSAMPDDEPMVQMTFDGAIEIVNTYLQVSPMVYTSAVYNFGADALVNYCQDVPGSTFFRDLRDAFHIYSITPGIVESSYDVSTGQTMVVPDFIKKLNLADLQQLKTPWGRAYMALAQKYGQWIWGLT